MKINKIKLHVIFGLLLLITLFLAKAYAESDRNTFEGVEETPQDQVSKYRKGCIYKDKEKKKDILYIEMCAPLGEHLEILEKADQAREAYLMGCKEKDAISCLRLGAFVERAEGRDAALKYYKAGCEAGNPTSCEKFKEKPRSEFLIWVAVILVGILTFMIAKNIFQDEESFKASEKLDDEVPADVIAKHGAILKYSRPFFKRFISPVVNNFKAKKKIREKYRRVLANSGLTNVLTADDFFSFKLFLIIGFPLLFIGIRIFLEEHWPLTIVPVLAVVGFFYPDQWVKGKAKQRKKEFVVEMPFAVDMLALSVEAGLDFMAAMSKVVQKARPSALTEEFQILLRETKVGASRAQALRNLSWRIDLIQVSSFCATLIAADSVGASIGPILKSLSAEIRQKKSADAEKAGATAATKILFPMLFLIVPAVFIIVGAPLLLQFMAP